MNSKLKKLLDSSVDFSVYMFVGTFIVIDQTMYGLRTNTHENMAGFKVLQNYFQLNKGNGDINY